MVPCFPGHGVYCVASASSMRPCGLSFGSLVLACPNPVLWRQNNVVGRRYKSFDLFPRSRRSSELRTRWPRSNGEERWPDDTEASLYFMGNNRNGLLMFSAVMSPLVRRFVLEPVCNNWCVYARASLMQACHIDDSQRCFNVGQHLLTNIVVKCFCI